MSGWRGPGDIPGLDIPGGSGPTGHAAGRWASHRLQAGRYGGGERCPIDVGPSGQGVRRGAHSCLSFRACCVIPAPGVRRTLVLRWILSFPLYGQGPPNIGLSRPAPRTSGKFPSPFRVRLCWARPILYSGAISLDFPISGVWPDGHSLDRRSPGLQNGEGRFRSRVNGSCAGLCRPGKVLLYVSFITIVVLRAGWSQRLDGWAPAN